LLLLILGPIALLLGLTHTLQLLEQLLRGPHARSTRWWCSGLLWLWRRWLRFRFIGSIICIRLRCGGRSRCRCAPGSRGEDKLTWCAVVQVPKQYDVVGGSIEKIGEHVARSSGTERAKDALVPSQALDLHSALGSDLVQDRRQAGIIRPNVELVRIEVDLRVMRGLLQKRRSHLGGCRLRRRRWLSGLSLRRLRLS
jgi:hypothetical protein